LVYLENVRLLPREVDEDESKEEGWTWRILARGLETWRELQEESTIAIAITITSKMSLL